MMRTSPLGPVATKLLLDVVASGVTARDSEDGSAVGPDEARGLIATLGANYTRSEVADAISELRKLPASQRAMLTAADVDGLDAVMQGIGFFRPAMMGSFPEPADCKPLRPDDRILFEEACNALFKRHQSARNAFTVAAERGDSCHPEQQTLNTLAAQMRALNNTVLRIAHPGHRLEDLRQQLRTQHNAALQRPAHSGFLVNSPT